MFRKRALGLDGEQTTTTTYYNPQGLVIGIDDSVEGLRLFSYDEAHQLTAVRSAAGVHSFVYDQAGFLIKEATADGVVREYSYDGAGQLVGLADSVLGSSELVYDGLGRRVRWVGGDGVVTEFGFSPVGLLGEVSTRVAGSGSGAGADAGQVVRLWNDALGQVAGAAGTGVPADQGAGIQGSDAQGAGMCSVLWDPTAGAPAVSALGGVPVSLAGAVVQDVLGGRGVDPFGVSPVMGGSSVSAAGSSSSSSSTSATTPGFGVSVAGSLQVAGLEILGVRAYDAASRGFISPDPLVSPVGAGWASNVYAFVGNDPVGLVDPWGLSPVTAGEFREYASLGAGRGAGGRVLGLVSAWRVGFGLASGLGERVQGLIDSAPESFKRLKTVVSAMGNTLGELGKLAKMTLPYVPAIARKFWDDNWQYIVAGVTTVVAVGLLFTPLAPAGVLMLSGMAVGGGIELLFQAFSGEPLDKKALANAVSIGGWSNLVGGAALSGTLKVASKLGGASKLMGRSGTAVANFAPRLEKFGVSIAQGAARVKSTVSSVQAATGRAFAPVVSVAQGAERLGAAAVARVPVVNAVAERFIVARGRLDAASSAAGAMASSVGNVAETSVTNVMDYGMNTPLSEQSPGGYARAAAAAPVSAVVVPKLVSKNGENMLRRVEVSSELTKNAGEYIGEYASGFSNYLLTEDDINIRQANREGFKNVSAAFAENLTEKGNGSK